MKRYKPAQPANFPEANPNPVLSAGADGVLQFVNPATLQLLEELKRTQAEDILPVDHRQLVATCLRTRALQTAERVTDGRTLAWSYRPIDDSDLIYIYGHDVSAYRSEHSCSRGLPRANPNPVLSCDVDGRAQFINPAALQLIQNLKLERVEELLPRDHKGLVSRCLDSGAALTEEHTVKGRNIAWSYCAVENARLVYIYGHDVTDYRSSISGTDDLPILHAVLDNLITPILIVDRALRVNFTNHAAEKFMSDDGGLRIERGVLCGPVSSVTRKLQELVENTQENGTALKIPRFYEEGVYEILVSPLRLEKYSQPSSLVIVYLFDPQLALGAFNDILTSLYGLTPAEVKLTERLVKGDTLQQAVEELGIAMSTARTQLKFVFRKTGTTHQSDLIRRIIMGPAGQARLQ